MISQRAYEIWETQGRPEGLSVQHWLQAESELKTYAQPSLPLSRD